MAIRAAIRAVIALMLAREAPEGQWVIHEAKHQPREAQCKLEQQASQAHEQEALEPLTVLCEVLCCLIFDVSVIF